MPENRQDSESRALLALARAESRAENEAAVRRAADALARAGRFALADRVLGAWTAPDPGDRADLGARLRGDVALLEGDYDRAHRAYESIEAHVRPRGITELDAELDVGDLAARLRAPIEPVLVEDFGGQEVSSWRLARPTTGTLRREVDRFGRLAGRYKRGEHGFARIELVTRAETRGPEHEGHSHPKTRRATVRSIEPVWNGDTRLFVRFHLLVQAMPNATGFSALIVDAETGSPLAPLPELALAHTRNGQNLEGDRYAVSLAYPDGGPGVSIGEPQVEFPLQQWLVVDYEFVPELRIVHAKIDYADRGFHKPHVSRLHVRIDDGPEIERKPYALALRMRQHFVQEIERDVVLTVFLDEVVVGH